MRRGFRRITRSGTPLARNRSTGGGRVAETPGKNASGFSESAPGISGARSCRCFSTGSLWVCALAGAGLPGAAAVCAMDGFEQDNNKIAVQPIHQRTGGSRSLFFFIQSGRGIIDDNSGGCQLGEILTLSDWFANVVRLAALARETAYR